MTYDLNTDPRRAHDIQVPWPIDNPQLQMAPHKRPTQAQDDTPEQQSSIEPTCPNCHKEISVFDEDKLPSTFNCHICGKEICHKCEVDPLADDPLCEECQAQPIPETDAEPETERNP